MQKDIKPLFVWAIENGDSKIIDRIIMKLIPEFLKRDIKITQDSLSLNDAIYVDSDFFEVVKSTTEKLVNKTFDI